MKHRAREWQFHFEADTFNLVREETPDPDRLAALAQLEEINRAKARIEAQRQQQLFTESSKTNNNEKVTYAQRRDLTCEG